MNTHSLIVSSLQHLRRGATVAGAALVLALAGMSCASAQSTTGSIFGKAPAGDTVTVRSTGTGAGRTVHVDANGRYEAGHLPVDVYTVVLKQDGKPVLQHPNVQVLVSRGVQVDLLQKDAKE